MSKRDKTILVTGATGKQGGATVRHLLAEGWHVRALVRDPQSQKALALRERGVELVKGDLTDRPALDRAFWDVWGVFAVITPFEQGTDFEVAAGRNLADAAIAADVGHFVYSSVGGAERQTGIPHFESKWQIEHSLRAEGLPLTVLRPVYFMENIGSFAQLMPIDDGYTLAMPLYNTTPLQMIAVDDIGRFAAIAFADRQRYLGRAIEIAGDELTMPEAARVISEVIGRKVKYIQVPLEVTRSQSEDAALMFDWLNREGYSADIERLNEIHAGLTRFRTWVEQGHLSDYGTSATTRAA